MQPKGLKFVLFEFIHIVLILEWSAEKAGAWYKDYTSFVQNRSDTVSGNRPEQNDTATAVSMYDLEETSKRASVLYQAWHDEERPQKKQAKDEDFYKGVLATTIIFGDLNIPEIIGPDAAKPQLSAKTQTTANQDVKDLYFLQTGIKLDRITPVTTSLSALAYLQADPSKIRLR